MTSPSPVPPRRLPLLRHAFALLLLLAAALLPLRAADRVVRVNLGTLAPRGSSFHQALQAMGDQWSKASAGSVKLVIFPDGSQGSDSKMVSLMRVGTLQAGLLTATGLTEIESGVAGLQNFPLLFRDFDELEYANARIRGRLEKRLEEKGFVVLFWSDAGWVRYFSKQPMLTPDDMKKRKVFVWAGNTHQVDMMKKAGYNPVPLEPSDIVQGLLTDLIDAVPVPPVYALYSQFEKRAPHMVDLRWAPMVGGLVIRKETWEKIPPALREPMLKAAAEAGKQIQANNRKEADEAIEKMRKNGLTVHSLTPEMEAQWRTETEKFYPEIRGRLVPAEIFDEVLQIVKEYRAGAGKK